MLYYILYENNFDDHDYIMVIRKLHGEVTAFIEEKVNKHGYGVDDFLVIHGIPCSLAVAKTPVKISMMG